MVSLESVERQQDSVLLKIVGMSSPKNSLWVQECPA
jgi:hypothetical protein